MTDELELLVEKRIKPLLEEAMNKQLGFSIGKLESDISDKLKRSALLEFDISTAMKFKMAKKKFKREYIRRLLMINSGNVADVAKVAGVDRRSVHRIVAEMKLEVQTLRDSLERKNYTKELAVRDIIQDSLEQFKESLNPVRYQALYQDAPVLSKNIVKVLPERPKTLKEAEQEFERKYLELALEENDGNISKTARKIGLRFETLHRKLKNLGISTKD